METSGGMTSEVENTADSQTQIEIFEIDNQFNKALGNIHGERTSDMVRASTDVSMF
jgi:hypothetical protein